MKLQFGLKCRRTSMIDLIRREKGISEHGL